MSSLPALHFLSLNPEAPTTILLIHGAFASSSDWSLVIPFLTSPIRHDYQIIVPDLPAHGASTKSNHSFSISDAADQLATLICQHARNSTAHVVGLSLGSLVALQLTARYPDSVSSLFVSGCSQIRPTRLKTLLLPYGFYLDHMLTSIVPRPIVRYVMDGIDFAPSSGISTDLCHQVATAILSSPSPETFKLIPRTLIVAATKAGIVPSNDSISDARTLLNAAYQTNPQSRAVQHRQMRHPWNRQNPKLFAETVVAWIEKREIPKGFEDL